MYYELAAERAKQGKQGEVALLRLEQLAPFPFDLVMREMRRFPNAGARGAGGLRPAAARAAVHLSQWAPCTPAACEKSLTMGPVLSGCAAALHAAPQAELPFGCQPAC